MVCDLMRIRLVCLISCLLLLSLSLQWQTTVFVQCSRNRNASSVKHELIRSNVVSCKLMCEASTCSVVRILFEFIQRKNIDCHVTTQPKKTITAFCIYNWAVSDFFRLYGESSRITIEKYIQPTIIYIRRVQSTMNINSVFVRISLA